MVYFVRGELSICSLEQRHIDPLVQGFAQQGWHKPKEQYLRYFQEQQEGTRRVLVAQLGEETAGYLNLLPRAKHGPFAQTDFPEISDFNVLQKYQRRGIGSALLDTAEALARETSPVVTLGVGLHPGYGAAQRLYCRRGYLLEGSGVWYQDQQLPENAPCRNDDSLVLYLSKKL